MGKLEMDIERSLHAVEALSESGMLSGHEEAELRAVADALRQENRRWALLRREDPDAWERSWSEAQEEGRLHPLARALAAFGTRVEAAAAALPPERRIPAAEGSPVTQRFAARLALDEDRQAAELRASLDSL